jgi:hypothetical protein
VAILKNRTKIFLSSSRGMMNQFLKVYLEENFGVRVEFLPKGNPASGPATLSFTTEHFP